VVRLVEAVVVTPAGVVVSELLLLRWVLSELKVGVVDDTEGPGLTPVPQDVAENRTRAKAIARPRPGHIFRDER